MWFFLSDFKVPLELCDFSVGEVSKQTEVIDFRRSFVLPRSAAAVSVAASTQPGLPGKWAVEAALDDGSGESFELTSFVGGRVEGGTYERLVTVPSSEEELRLKITLKDHRRRPRQPVLSLVLTKEPGLVRRTSRVGFWCDALPACGQRR